jgi:SP family sugar:H+ symporter-like MFS transporter
MAILNRSRGGSPTPASSTADPEKKPKMLVVGMRERFSPRILLMAVIVSMGGFIFGYDTGQISGFLEMPDFLRRFADTTDPVTGDFKFTNGRSGTIVALVSRLDHNKDGTSN